MSKLYAGTGIGCLLVQELHSGSVLIIQAALRKICSQCNVEDATADAEMKQLIEPQLLESFLACCGLDESIV